MFGDRAWNEARVAVLRLGLCGTERSRRTRTYETEPPRIHRFGTARLTCRSLVPDIHGEHSDADVTEDQRADPCRPGGALRRLNVGPARASSSLDGSRAGDEPSGHLPRLCRGQLGRPAASRYPDVGDGLDVLPPDRRLVAVIDDRRLDEHAPSRRTSALTAAPCPTRSPTGASGDGSPLSLVNSE